LDRSSPAAPVQRDPLGDQVRASSLAMRKASPQTEREGTWQGPGPDTLCQAPDTAQTGPSGLLQLPQLGPGARVQDLLLRQPGSPRLGDSHLDVVERPDLVRVARDDQLDPRLARRPRVDVAQIESVGLRVELEAGPRLDRVSEH